MKKLFINPFELVPGMKIAETILNDYGAIVISEGTILDDHLINKLGNLGLYRLQIFVGDDVKVENPDSFTESYNESVSDYKKIISDIANGVDLNPTKIDNVVNSVLQRVEEKRDIVSCLNQIKSADEYTYTHSVNVSLISMLIGKWMKFEPERIKLLVQAGLLHDIGKTLVPLEILNKPGKLTQLEFAEMKKHTVYGYRILEKVPSISKDVLAAVLMHHEKEDGTGYPTGLGGDKINMLAKIVSVADIYDAMTSNRVYKDKESPFEVFQLIEENSIGTLNPIVVNAFLSNIAAYYIGDKVKLASGEIGEIVYINPRCVSKPIVKVDDKYIDMLTEKDVKIKEII
ncbi:HD-GYP domain-containing protein [Acetivibrio cellulolyticus]|uniref:HD-GYP domain-containing protein n=1 Tax=Acetivibrio cellulolyticus TaxID=35830 RepID=UPI0001E2E6D8|nr:HD-GYP domain-containing protein [Acetivibrio cellulolyticus]